MTSNDIRGRVAIVGVGATEQGELPGSTADEVAVDALALALKHAGMKMSELDGLITCKSFGGFGIDTSIGRLAGLNPAYSATLDYGTCNFSLHLAASVIHAGLASAVAITYGTTQRSQRNSFSNPVGSADEATDTAFLMLPAGCDGLSALPTPLRRLRTTARPRGGFAAKIRRTEQSGYLSRALIDRRLSCAALSRRAFTQIRPVHDSDGGAALIVTTAEKARDLVEVPITMLGMAQQTGLRDRQNPDQWMRPWIKEVADRVYAAAGIKQDEIDVLYVQDPTSIWLYRCWKPTVLSVRARRAPRSSREKSVGVRGCRSTRMVVSFRKPICGASFTSLKQSANYGRVRAPSDCQRDDRAILLDHGIHESRQQHFAR